MNLIVNGEAKDIKEGSTVRGMLENLGITAARVAVEVNLEIVPKATFEERILQDGDRIEIVHFVGGG